MTPEQALQLIYQSSDWCALLTLVARARVLVDLHLDEKPPVVTLNNLSEIFLDTRYGIYHVLIDYGSILVSTLTVAHQKSLVNFRLWYRRGMVTAYLILYLCYYMETKHSLRAYVLHLSVMLLNIFNITS